MSGDSLSKHFVRPNARWKCSLKAYGMDCGNGPDRSGKCVHASQCDPEVIDGRWQCRRAAILGGPCAEGPSADGACSHNQPRCHPSATPGSHRVRFVRWTLLFSVLAVLMLLSLQHWQFFVQSGPLNQMHANLDEHCQHCHSAANESPVSWFWRAFNPHSGYEESNLCQACHYMGENALDIHSLEPAKLQSLSDNVVAPKQQNPPELIAIRERLQNSHLAGLFQTNEEPIFCATCHQEHSSESFLRGHVSDIQCINCHQLKFNSFSSDHPGLGSYPYKRRTAIVFDHRQHIDNYFNEKKYIEHAKNHCEDCHQITPKGFIGLKSFAQNCLACHEADIMGASRSGMKGLEILTIPGIDTETLNATVGQTGEWPADADKELDGLMALLLGQSHAQLVAAVYRRDMLDLTDAGEVQRQQAAELIWVVKTFLAEIARGGQSQWSERFEQLCQCTLNQQQKSALSAALSRESLQAYLAAVFPHLLQEVRAYQDNRPLPVFARQEQDIDIAPEMATPESDATIATGNSDNEEFSLELDLDDETLGTEEQVARGSDSSSGDDFELELDLDDETAEGHERLASDPDASNDDDFELELALDLDAGLTDDNNLATPENSRQASIPPEHQDAIAEAPVLSNENWVGNGGWYIDNATLFYRPTGHADAFMQMLLELLTAMMPEDDREMPQAMSGLFSQLTSEKSVGQCMKCHSIEQSSPVQHAIADPHSPAAVHNDALAMPAGNRVNWLAARYSADKKFTFFNHFPHLIPPFREKCQACHALDEQENYLEQYRQFNPAEFTSNFTPIDKSQCVKCHAKEKSGEACLDCHNYHVGKSTTTLLKNPINKD